MLNNFIIAYDLSGDKGVGYDSLLEIIRTQADFCQLSESAYFIKTELDPDELKSLLLPCVDGNDTLSVFEVDPFVRWFTSSAQKQREISRTLVQLGSLEHISALGKR